MNTKSFLYLFTAFLCVQIAPTYSTEGGIHEVENLTCFKPGCGGYLRDTFEFDMGRKVYECSNGHRFTVGR